MAPPPFRFTSYDLDSSIEVARVLLERGNGVASADELAVFLGYSKAKNGAFLTRLANARLFGLVEGPSNQLRPTTRAVRLLRPDYPANADRARLEAFEEVPLFKVVLDHYHGQTLPDDTGLRNALETRWGIAANKSAFVLSRLMDSAEQAGLFRIAGNRSKMVRPTFQVGHESHVAEDGNGAGGDEDDLGSDHGGTDGHQRHPRGHKLIDGALELLPDGDWTEEEMQQWLLLMEMALRVAYRLPKNASPLR
jgi:hypothetical protein